MTSGCMCGLVLFINKTVETKAPSGLHEPLSIVEKLWDSVSMDFITYACRSWKGLEPSWLWLIASQNMQLLIPRRPDAKLRRQPVSFCATSSNIGSYHQ